MFYFKYFNVANGVRQGGISSPKLFSIYIDGLSNILNHGRMQDFSGWGLNFKISVILDIHAAKRHVASTEAASLC